MPKRISKAKKKRPKRPTDFNQLAHQLVIESTEDEGDDNTKKLVSEFMKKMGSKGGKIGGARRMETMTAEQRSDIALRAAKARWNKKQG